MNSTSYDNRKCLYKPGDLSIYDFVKEELLETEIRKTAIEPFLKEGYELLTFKEATEKINLFAHDKFCKPFKEISEERFEDMYEILPPADIQNYRGAFMFRMSEFTYGNITGHYIRMNGRYFTADRPVTTPIKEVCDEIYCLINNL